MFRSLLLSTGESWLLTSGSTYGTATYSRAQRSMSRAPSKLDWRELYDEIPCRNLMHQRQPRVDDLIQLRSLCLGIGKLGDGGSGVRLGRRERHTLKFVVCEVAENVFRAAWYEHRDLPQVTCTGGGGDAKDLEEVWHAASQNDIVVDTTKGADGVERRVATNGLL